jgi:predicted small metal-binding protein
MKLYHCGTLVPGCDWHTRDEDEAEIVSRALHHMRNAHGEDSVNAGTVGKIKERIRTEADLKARPSREAASARA